MMVKRFISILLTIMVVVTTIPLASAVSDDDVNPTIGTNGASIEGSNDFGGVLSDAVEKAKGKETSDFVCNVADVAIENNVAEVTVVADRNAKVLVGAYDENTDEVLATGFAVVSPETETVEVKLDTMLPEHYVVKAAVVDGNNNPVSDSFVDTDNTQWYEEFTEIEVSDFDEEYVLNLDDSSDKNFVVFQDSVVMIDSESTIESSKELDETTSEYVFSGKDFDAQEGEVFCYNKNDVENMVLGKVTDVRTDGDDCVITAEGVELEETFKLMKIEYYEDECEIASVKGGELVYPENTPKSRFLIVDGEISKEKPVEASFKTTIKDFKVNVTASFKTKIVVEYFFTVFTKRLSAEISVTPTFRASVNGKNKLEKEVSLGEVNIPVMTGVFIVIPISLTIKASCELTASFTMTRKFAFKYTYGENAKNTSTKPVVESDIKLEGMLEFGIEIGVEISLFKVVNIGVEGYIGIRITAKVQWSYSSEATKRHMCAECFDFNTQLVLSLDVIIKIGCSIFSKTFTYPLIKRTTLKSNDYYWSLSYHEMGSGSCPHIENSITFEVVDKETKKQIKKSSVNGKATSNGKGKFWLENGKYNYKISAPGYKSIVYVFAVEKPLDVTIELEKGDSNITDKQIDSSYATQKRSEGSFGGGSGGGGFRGVTTYVSPSKPVEPLIYVEPSRSAVLSTAVSDYRRNDVAWVQNELGKLGYTVTINGYYGNSTANAVRAFQNDYFLPVTGIVNAETLSVIKKPLKKVSSPVLRLASPKTTNIMEQVTVTWDAVPYATYYDVYIYRPSGAISQQIIGTRATAASFLLNETGVFTIKAYARNDRFTSPVSANLTVGVVEKTRVNFYDWDGTLIEWQFVEYGGGATTPPSPERTGYTFERWDRNYSRLTGGTVNVYAVYKQNEYNVRFLNTDGKEIHVSKCKYRESATAPDITRLSVPSGCEFIGWDRSFDCVIGDLTIRPVIQYLNDDLPIIIEDYNVVKDANYGYNVTVTVKNYDKMRTNGRVVVALKTASNKFVTMTESSAFTLAKSNFSSNVIQRETLEIYIPCSENVAYVDIFVVSEYDDLIPISESVRFTVGSGSVGEMRTISGTVDSSLVGKQAILFIYKIGDAADFTNEYVGQGVIGTGGTYSFSYNLREEPSVSTGDMYAVLGIEGADNSILLDDGSAQGMQALIAPKPVYTVTIKNWDGTVISTQPVTEGDSAIMPVENPQRTGYIFAGWDYTNTSIFEDLTITAIYVPKKYSVVFIDWTNQRFDMDTYTYGETLIAPDLSTLDDYTAIGWEGVVEGTTVTQHMVITAKYEKKAFTVKFYDYNNNVIDEQLVEYGEEAEVPTLEDDSGHVFYEWDQTEFDCVTGAMNVYPRFRYAEDTVAPTANYQSGVYSNSVLLMLSCSQSGSLIYYSVDGGEYVEYHAPILINNTATVSYYSSSLGKNNSADVVGNYIINKVGDEQNWKYPVNVYNDGSLIGAYVLASGSALGATTLPVTMDNYVLDGFYLDPDMTQPVANDYQLNSEINVYAKFNPEQYTVTFKDIEGNVLSTQSVAYLGEAIAPETVDTPAGFVFLGWDKDDFYCVTEDTEVTAVIKHYNDIDAVTLSRCSYTMMEGYTYQLTATVKGEGKSEILWKSDDESIATVDANGKITSVSEGVVVIRATLLEKEISECCYVTVTANPALSVKLNDDSRYYMAELFIGGISPSGNTVSAVEPEFETENVRFFDGETELIGSDKLFTGAQVRLYNDNNELLDEKIIVVAGDVDGNGVAGVADASHLTRHLIAKEALDGCYLLAADANGDGYVNNRDASLIMRYVVSKELF